MAKEYEGGSEHKMTTNAQTTIQALKMDDPILRFLADGGSWADAVEMEYDLKIPVWSAQLKKAMAKRGPSAVKHQQRVLADLREAYAYKGSSVEAFEAAIAELLAS